MCGRSPGNTWSWAYAQLRWQSPQMLLPPGLATAWLHLASVAMEADVTPQAGLGIALCRAPRI